RAGWASSPQVIPPRLFRGIALCLASARNGTGRLSVPDTSLTAREYIGRVEEIVARGGPKDETVKSIQALLTHALEVPGWLPERCCSPAADCYARHLLYRDPMERFTIVAMVWERGQM